MSVIAFRRWSVAFSGRLQAAHMWFVPDWAPGAVTTSACHCAMGSDHDSPKHPYPVSDSACGLYAYKYPFPACACPRWGRDHGAVGVIEGFGRTVEHQRGWRFEKARVLALCDLTDAATWPTPADVQTAPWLAEGARARTTRDPWLSPDYGRSGVAVYRDLDAMWAEWAPDLPTEPDRGRRGQFWCDWKPPRTRTNTDQTRARPAGRRPA